jgi:GNAT superfamily N-acetyltransferase
MGSRASGPCGVEGRSSRLSHVVNLTTRVIVTVTFLRTDMPPTSPRPPVPPDTSLVRLARPSVGFYRYLYDTVGAPHVWWLRRALPDNSIAPLLADPAISIHVLYRGGEPAGFFELDGRARPDMNLSYFGLVPQAVGKGLGAWFLRAAVDEAFRGSNRGVTVNTCTADHPRALPTYLRVGFRPMRSVREVWDVPNQLGLVIPDHLRA